MSKFPTDWRTTSIQNIAEVIRGSSPRPQGDPRYYGGDIPRLMVADISRDGKYVTPKIDSLTEEGAGLSRPVSAGTLVIVCSGVTAGDPTILTVPACIHDGLIALVNMQDDVYTEFLYYSLLYNKEALFAVATHGGAYSNLTTSIVRDFKLVLPSLAEQRKIAAILSTWDEAIDLTEQLIAAKQRRNQALMQRLLTGQVRFPGFTISDEIQHTPYGTLPTDWHYPPIAAIAKQVNDFNRGDLALPVLSCTKHDGLVDSLEYFGRQMFSDDLSKYKIVSRSQFAYATNHIEEGSIGYQNLYDAALISPMYTVFQADPKQICDGFLYRVLKTEKYRQIFELNTNGSVNRRGSLRWNEFSKIEIPLPPLAEQQKIAATIDTFDEELVLHQQKLAALRRQKQGLMQQLLTGRVRVAG